ncbi:hypothetical protein [Azospirillum sp. sgz302134]
MISPHALAFGSVIAASATLIGFVPHVAPRPTGPVVCVMPDHRQTMAEVEAEVPESRRAYLPVYLVNPTPPACPSNAVLAFIPRR